MWHIVSQWGLLLIFRMHNSDPTSQRVENRNILLWIKCVLTALHVNCMILFDKQYDEYCLSIMQTITYAHDRTHCQGIGRIVSFDIREWN
jgi:hypothetical protein